MDLPFPFPTASVATVVLVMLIASLVLAQRRRRADGGGGSTFFSGGSFSFGRSSARRRHFFQRVKCPQTVLEDEAEADDDALVNVTCMSDLNGGLASPPLDLSRATLVGILEEEFALKGPLVART